MSTPDVSVIIGVYNAMPYLVKCVTSVLEQSIGLDRIEIIAIDDGSTDGSGEQLDLFAASYPVLNVIHQPNSGGPSRPRNVGLDHAAGRYVFFLDADDYLGPEALERLLRMADDNGSDIVLPRPAGVNGRRVARAMFKTTEPKVDLFASEVYRTLSCQKLFRRSFIERLGLRFPEDLRIVEDQFFTAPAFLNAGVISVLADGEYYFLRRRSDGMNITAQLTVPVEVELLERILPLVGRHVEPGPRRDFINRRHFGQMATGVYGPGFLKADRVVQQDALARGKALLAEWYTPGAAQYFSPARRIKFHLVSAGALEPLIEFIRAETAGEEGKDVVDKGRIFAGYRAFRDPALNIPDECFDATAQRKPRHHLGQMSWQGTALRLSGYAYIDHVDTTDPATEVVLRERDSLVEHRLAVEATATPELTTEFGEGRYDYGRAGFAVNIDPSRADNGSPLPSGRWDVFLAVRSQGVVKEVRFGHNRAESIDDSPRTRVLPISGKRGTVVTPYFTKPYGNLTLDVGQKVHRFAPKVRIDRVTWSGHGPTALVITGRADLGKKGELPEAEVRVALSTSGGPAHRLRADLDAGTGDRGFVAVLPLASALGVRPMPHGDWTIGVEFVVAGLTWPIPVPTPAKLPAARWSRNGLPALATVRSNRGDPLILSLTPMSARAAARRVLRAARRRLVG